LPFRIYAYNGYAFTAYAEQLAILNKAKQGSLYSSCQGTNVDAVPPGTPNMCAHDAYVTLNFITDLVCHPQLIPYITVLTKLY